MKKKTIKAKKPSASSEAKRALSPVKSVISKGRKLVSATRKKEALKSIRSSERTINSDLRKFAKGKGTTMERYTEARRIRSAMNGLVKTANRAYGKKERKGNADYDDIVTGSKVNSRALGADMKRMHKELYPKASKKRGAGGRTLIPGGKRKK